LSVLNQFEQIGALDGIASGENEYRNFHLRNLVD